MNLEYSGFFMPYATNVPLSEADMELQLKQKEKLDYDPCPGLALVKINSTYLESVDKYYDSRGFTLPILFFGIGLGSAIASFSIIETIRDTLFPHPSKMPLGSFSDPANVLFMIFALALGGGLIWFLYKMFLSKEMFSRTHFPIRLNRKNRMVYATRLDGTVLSVPWDDVFFTTGRGQKSRSGLNQYWNIRGHVLDKDRKTIKETFAFSIVDGNPDTSLLKHWEFLRRYMEEGPQHLLDRVEFCWPIDKCKEDFFTGFKAFCSVPISSFYRREKGDVLIWRVVAFPFSLLYLLSMAIFVPFRWLAMRTCKLPVWPQVVEEACWVEPDDPYVRDSSTNPTFPPKSAIFF